MPGIIPYMERWSLSVARSLLSMSSRALVATHFMSVSVSRISLDFLGYGDGFFVPTTLSAPPSRGGLALWDTRGEK